MRHLPCVAVHPLRANELRGEIAVKAWEVGRRANLSLTTNDVGKSLACLVSSVCRILYTIADTYTASRAETGVKWEEAETMNRALIRRRRRLMTRSVVAPIQSGPAHCYKDASIHSNCTHNDHPGNFQRQQQQPAKQQFHMVSASWSVLGCWPLVPGALIFFQYYTSAELSSLRTLNFCCCLFIFF